MTHIFFTSNVMSANIQDGRSLVKREKPRFGYNITLNQHFYTNIKEYFLILFVVVFRI